MGAIHALRIKSPYKLLHVEDIKINCCSNEHGTLYLKCLVDDSINYKYSIEASTNDEIIVYEENDDEDNTLEVDINKVDASKSRVLFNGIINRIRTINDNSIYYIEINAVSKSAELDIKKKSRSFQDISMTYDELIAEVLKDYKDKDFIQSVGIGESINTPIFQYEETDWEFLKRICSILDSEVYCDIINLNNLFYFGKSEGENYEITDDIPYKACKDLKSFYKAGGYDSGYHDTDYFYYEINTREKYNLFDNVYFKQKDSYVSEYSSCKYQDELIYKYKLCRKNGVWQTKIYNSLISGASLEGKVLDTQGEEVKLKLNIDKDDGKSAWFRFAPPTGSAMYSMPVVGTSARLYFPDATSKEPLVTGCVRTNGATCAKTSDTSKRYFGTEHGSEVEMTPSAFNIKGGSASPISISLDDNKGVTITSPSKLTLDADSEIVFKTPKNVKINGVSQINAQKGKSSSGFSLETDLNFLSNNVIKNGSCTESYPDFEDDPEEGEMPEPEPEEDSGFSWGKLALAAVAAVAITAVSVATLGVGTTLLIGAAIGATMAISATNEKAGKWLYATLEVVGGTIAVVSGGILLVDTGGTASPLAIAGMIHGGNSLANGVRDFNYLINGDYDDVGTKNYLRDQGYKFLGEKSGELVGVGADFITGKDYYRDKFGKAGEQVGNIAYYGMDVYSGFSTVKDSAAVIRDVPKLKNLSTTYETGNWIDGYKRMNDLKLWTEGSPYLVRAYQGINASVNADTVYYDSKDIKDMYIDSLLDN